MSSGFIWINIKHPSKIMGHTYSIENTKLMQDISEY
jgi:hypothetical protein